MATSDYEYEFEEEDHEDEEFFHSQDEYEESESYEYPWSTSSDDSYKDLSSDEAIQKIIEKLPTYSSESSDAGYLFPILYESASDSDAGSFIERDINEENGDDQKAEFYKPEIFLNSVETYNMYIISHTGDEDSDENETPIPSEENIEKVVEISNDKPQKQKQPDNEAKILKLDSSLIIQPTQSQIPTLSENAATEIDEIKTDIPTTKVLYTCPFIICIFVQGFVYIQPQKKRRIYIKSPKSKKRPPKKFKVGMKVQIKNNAKYDNAVGIIKYIGVIDENKMVGIEILDNEIMGNSNGMYTKNGQKYFECGENRGLFVSIKNIKKFINKEARKKSNEFKKQSRRRRRVQRNNAQMYGNVVDVLWKERIDLVKQGKYRVVHKPGPREFGRIEYFGGDEEYTDVLNDNTNWLKPRLTLPKKQKNQKKPEPKAGPRQIGRAEKYVGIEYDEEAESAKRAKKKAMIEEKKKKQFEKERLAKLERGRITRPKKKKSVGSDKRSSSKSRKSIETVSKKKSKKVKKKTTK